MAKFTRRTFLASSVAGVAAASVVGKVGAHNADRQVRYGVIGCGRRGHEFVAGASSVCDPDLQRLTLAAKLAGVDTAHAVTDMRRILDDRDIDAVVIATPDHWQTPAALLARAAGKHVYIETPGSQNFRESQMLVAAARSSNLVIHHGMEHRGRPLLMNAMAALRRGLVGDVTVAKAWSRQSISSIGHSQPAAPPSDFDYDLWVGPAEWIPFQPNRYHGDWRWWHRFGTGGIGTEGAELIDIARWGLGVDQFPTRITAIGGKYVFDDDQEFPDTATCIFEYPGVGASNQPDQLTFEMSLVPEDHAAEGDSGVEFYGTKGKMLMNNRGMLTAFGEDGRPLPLPGVTDDVPCDHFQRFLRCVGEQRGGYQETRETHLSVGLVHLANIAIRVGRSLEFDPHSEQLVGDGEASKLLSRSYRDTGHWAIPVGV